MTGFRNMILKRFILLLAVALVAGCAAPEKEEIQLTQAESPIIAAINGRPLYQDQFEGFLSLTLNEPGEELVLSQRRVRFREFVIEQLLLQEMERKEITVDEALVREQLASWLSEGQEVTPDLGERGRNFRTHRPFGSQTQPPSTAYQIDDVLTRNGGILSQLEKDSRAFPFQRKNF